MSCAMPRRTGLVYVQYTLGIVASFNRALLDTVLDWIGWNGMGWNGMGPYQYTNGPMVAVRGVWNRTRRARIRDMAFSNGFVGSSAVS
jgi:hypothetical protein